MCMCTFTQIMDKQTNKGHRYLTFIRPSVDTVGAVRLACSLYGLNISDPSLVREFVSYDDQNFYMKGTLPHVHHVHGNDGEGLLRKSEDEFVLKILNHVDSENISSVQGQNEALLFLKEMGFTCPVPSRALNGEYTIKCSLKSVEVGNTGKETEENEQSDRVHAVRLLRFVPGKLLRDVPCTAEVLFSLGRFSAKTNKALQV